MARGRLGAPIGASLNPMRVASPDFIQNTVLNAPVAVAEVPADTELRPALRALIIGNRLRAPVTGAHLVHKKLVVWEARPCSLPGHSELNINGVPWILPPVERFEPFQSGQSEAVAELIDLNPPFSAVEGYVLVVDGNGSAELRPGVWAVANRRSDLIDPVHGYRGVSQGWAYIGIPVLLDIALKPPPDRSVQRVDELPLRRMIINALHGRGIERLDQLVGLSHRELRTLPGVGDLAEQQIDAALAVLGLYLPPEPVS